MSIWQFKVSLVPEMGILRVHGTIPSELEDYRPFDPESDDLDQELPNYWEGHVVPPEVMEEISSILPPMESWSAEARMFGYSHGNQIEVWGHDVLCKVDLRAFDGEYLRRIVELADDLNSLIVLNENGRVLPADLSEVLEAVRKSRACRFMVNPAATLEEWKRGPDAPERPG